MANILRRLNVCVCLSLFLQNVWQKWAESRVREKETTIGPDQGGEEEEGGRTQEERGELLSKWFVVIWFLCLCYTETRLFLSLSSPAVAGWAEGGSVSSAGWLWSGEEEEGGRSPAAEHGDSGCLHGYETTKQHRKLN